MSIDITKLDDLYQKHLAEKREWVGLTMEDVAELRKAGAYSLSDRDAFAVDAMLRKKNTRNTDMCGND